MPFDVAPNFDPSARRRTRGQRAYRSGLAAEQLVADAYCADGYVVAAQRWRGPNGEIDLILSKGATLVIVEVKSSTCHDTARASLGQRQLDRLCASAGDYLAAQGLPLNTDLRMDLATVDATGGLERMENITLW